MKIKRLCFMLAVFLFILVLFQIPAFASEEVSFMTCDNGIVNIGDPEVAVQDKCGEPNSQGMNTWVYNFGPDEPAYTLIFDGGKVIRILEDEWGS